jgi:hypothetical protein
MSKHKPEGYDAAREAASGERIEFEDVERFVFEDAPGVDGADCKALGALRAIWQGNKMKVTTKKAVPKELIASANEDPKVVYFYKFCEDRNLLSAIEQEKKLIPVFTLQTDLYSCYDAAYDWSMYRIRAIKHLTNLDNGWNKHGIRLLARFQEYKLFKTQSWWKDDNSAFELAKGCRSKWETRKRKRQA